LQIVLETVGQGIGIGQMKEYFLLIFCRKVGDFKFIMVSSDPFPKSIFTNYIVQNGGSGFVMGIKGGKNGKLFFYNVQSKSFVIDFSDAEHATNQLRVFPVGFNQEWGITVYFCFFDKPVLEVKDIEI